MTDFEQTERTEFASELARTVGFGTDNPMKTANIVINALRDDYLSLDLFLNRVVSGEALAYWPAHKEDTILRQLRTKAMEIPGKLHKQGYIKFDYRNDKTVIYKTEKWKN